MFRFFLHRWLAVASLVSGRAARRYFLEVQGYHPREDNAWGQLTHAEVGRSHDGRFYVVWDFIGCAPNGPIEEDHQTGGSHNPLDIIRHARIGGLASMFQLALNRSIFTRPDPTIIEIDLQGWIDLG
jgi:hypothetical protein